MTTSQGERRCRRLIVLGSTGSIGTSALTVVEHLRRENLYDFEVVALAAGGNGERLARQARQLGVDQIGRASCRERV